jgi:hypothetical protein
MHGKPIIATALAIATAFAAGCQPESKRPLIVRLSCSFGNDIHLPITVNLGELRGTVITSTDSGISMPLTSEKGELILDMRSDPPFIVLIRADGSAKVRLKRDASSPIADIDGACERL